MQDAIGAVLRPGVGTMTPAVAPAADRARFEQALADVLGLPRPVADLGAGAVGAGLASASAPTGGSQGVQDTAAALADDAVPAASGGTVTVGSGAEFAAALASARPGEHIVLKDGTYAAPDGAFRLTAPGTPGAPVVIEAEHPLGAHLTSPLKLDGADQVASGLALDGASVTVAGDRSRVTGCRSLDATGDAVVIRSGANTRVDHCEISGPQGQGVAIRPDPDHPDALLRPRVDHNYLHDWKQVSDPDAHAAISIGESQRSDDIRLGAVVEANLLERIDGAHCAIEAKSSGNVIRGNTVLDSRAGIIVRHGSDNVVEANWVERAGGIWVRGIDTLVVGNTVRDSHGAGLRVLAGDEGPDMPGKGYPAASGTVLVGNDVDRLLVGYGYAGSTVPATGTRIEGRQGAAPVLTGLAKGTVQLPAPDGPVPAATRLSEAEVGPASLGSGGVASAGQPSLGVTRGYPLQAAVERRRADLEALGGALRAGDLAAARQAFGAVQEDRQAIRELRGIAGGAPSPYRADLQALRQALEAGDLEASRTAFTALGRDWPVLQRLQVTRASDIASGAGTGPPAGTGRPRVSPLDLVA